SAPNPHDAGLAPADTISVTVGGVTFEVQDNVKAEFPDGATSGTIFLSIVENSRTPVRLPTGIFSSTIVQLTPFSVRLTPGGKLTFPNSDKLPAGTQDVKLYRFNQTPGSPTTFVEAGTATVTADGQYIETAPQAITETSIFFVA